MSLSRMTATVLLSAALLAAGCREGKAEREAREAAEAQRAVERRTAAGAAAPNAGGTAAGERDAAITKSLEGTWYARMGTPERGFYSDMTLTLKPGMRYEMNNAMRGLRTGGQDVHSTGNWMLVDDVVELTPSSPPRSAEGDGKVKLKVTTDPGGATVTALAAIEPAGATFTRQPPPKAGPLGDPSAPPPQTRPAAAHSSFWVTPPAGWDPVPTRMPNVVATFVRTDDPKNQAIAVHAYSPPPAATLREWAEMNASRMKLMSEDTRTLSSQAAPVAGTDGWSLVLDVPKTGGGTSRVVQLLAIKAGHGVSVTATFPPERQEEATKLAADLMASVKARP